MAQLSHLLPYWVLALVMSAALVVAGARWPEPLSISLPLVWALLLVPPALMALLLLLRWPLASAPPPAATAPLRGDGGESSD
jgi:hypothetical protein